MITPEVSPFFKAEPTLIHPFTLQHIFSMAPHVWCHLATLLASRSAQNKPVGPHYGIPLVFIALKSWSFGRAQPPAHMLAKPKGARANADEEVLRYFISPAAVLGNWIRGSRSVPLVWPYWIWWGKLVALVGDLAIRLRSGNGGKL